MNLIVKRGSLTRSAFVSGLIILNAWYGKFVTDNSRKHERARVIDVTVPLQCLVKDSKLILTEASKVKHICICDVRYAEYNEFSKAFLDFCFSFVVCVFSSVCLILPLKLLIVKKSNISLTCGKYI